MNLPIAQLGFLFCKIEIGDWLGTIAVSKNDKGLLSRVYKE